MVVYTDSVDYARLVIGQPTESFSATTSFASDDARRLAGRVFEDRAVHTGVIPGDERWRYLFIVGRAPRSHYDVLVDLGRRGDAIPDGCLILAGAGESFHGFKGRAWSALPGNIHLAVHLVPPRPLEHAGVIFMVLAAVSVIDAIDAIPGLGGAAGIKWVNDILIDGAKVGGVLAYTHGAEGLAAGAVLGIGLNVETEPVIEPTPFVPCATALRSAAPEPEACTLEPVFAHLAGALDHNRRTLFEPGGERILIDRYRERSLVIGRDVAVCTEESGSDPDVIASGPVTRLGDDLELVLDGLDKPLTRGRLILGAPWKSPNYS